MRYWLREPSRRRRGPSNKEVRAISERFALAFRDALTRQLERCYSPDLSKLPRRGRRGNGSAPRISISGVSQGAPWRLVFRIRDNALVLEPSHPLYQLPQFDDEQIIRSRLASFSEERRAWMRQRRNLVTPVYFPAARSGYVQMQSVLASLLIGALGRGDFEQVSIGKISGIATDFLQFLVGIDPSRESPLPTTAADALERDLLRGHLRLASHNEFARTIEFAPEGLDEYWPMDSAATSIGEIAPLLLYLRHKATARDLLFIDEPEAHLHPANQIVLAGILHDLSEHLAGMVLATHSEFFVTGISNSVLRHLVRGRTRSTVAVYELTTARSTGGYEAVPVEVDPTVGFSVDQFSDVAESALDEAESLFEQGQQRTER